MTTRTRRKVARTRRAELVPAVSPRRALSMWGPPTKSWMETTIAEANDGMTTAAILQKMASGVDPLDKAHVEMMARHLYYHSARTRDAATNALSLFSVVQRGSWEGVEA